MALKKFDAEKYLKDGAKTYSLRGEVEALIDRITAKEYDSVCMIGIGEHGRMVSGCRSSQEILQIFRSILKMQVNFW